MNKLPILSNAVKAIVLTSLCFTLAACVTAYQAKKRQSGSTQLAAPLVSARHVDPIWPTLSSNVKPDADVELSVVDLLAKMTLAQKVAQMIQPEIRDITVADMRQYGFGSYLNGGGSFPDNNKHATAKDWIILAEKMYQASIDDSLDGSAIPTMWGTDAVHGHNNVIGATLFPHNIGLGATNNPQLIEKIAAITAKEVMVTGIDWVFAPTVAVVRDDRWGRAYEGYSEDPEIVSVYAKAIVKGLQGSPGKDFLDEHHVIGTVKHFLGDGGTENGDDQGNNLDNEQDLFALHAQGYISGLQAGAQTVMASFNSWHGVKNHGNKYLLTDVLKNRMGFDGIVVGDWNGHGQIPGCSNESCSQSINAGLDIFMVPTAAWKPLLENTLAQINSGEIPLVRINDAVSRILRVKIRAGLFDKPSPAQRVLSGKTELIGHSSHRQVARQAVQESLVLLKNSAGLLPLLPTQHILVAGDGADNIGKQSGGWSITWQGTNNSNSDFPGGTSIFQGIEKRVTGAGGKVELSPDGNYTRKPDVAIVVFGEEPYAEGNGDIDNLEYQRGNKRDLALLKKLRAQGIAVVSVFISGRPMWVNAELNASNAFVAAWLPGSEGQGISDVLFSKSDGTINVDFSGKLSFSWPAHPQQTQVNRFDTKQQPLLPYGFGLSYGDKDLLSNKLIEQYETNSTQLDELVLFKGAVKAPWKMFIGTAKDNQPIIASIQQNDAISIRAIDKRVQQDARQINWNGKGKGTLSLTSAFPRDLRGYLEKQAALTFNVKVDQIAPGPVYLAMGCEGQCNITSIDITDIIADLALNSWQEVSVDLNCFNQKGADLGRVFTPFSLFSAGRFSMAFADIVLTPNKANNATVSCQ